MLKDIKEGYVKELSDDVVQGLLQPIVDPWISMRGISSRTFVIEMQHHQQTIGCTEILQNDASQAFFKFKMSTTLYFTMRFSVLLVVAHDAISTMR